MSLIKNPYKTHTDMKKQCVLRSDKLLRAATENLYKALIYKGLAVISHIK